MIQFLAKPLVDLASTWINRRAEKAEAKHTRDLQKITGELDLDNTSASGMQQSLKDEWLTIVFTIPMVVVFYGAITNDSALIERITASVVTITQLPDWYVNILYGIVAASFGLRTFHSLKK